MLRFVILHAMNNKIYNLLNRKILFLYFSFATSRRKFIRERGGKFHQPYQSTKTETISISIRSSKMDHYKVLGLHRTAAKEEIKTAFKKLAFQFHSGKHSPSPRAIREMKRKLQNQSRDGIQNPNKFAF
ncbi:hypothetical protein VIGAN_05076200 [Vigna angularis var. angularis]|uniref:J domain-containing protein n=1 Tax=Vigna angularis var. angularis TaxID=157739 RepID=A0A0S3S3K9_PHAAN|nr:hypothetical protein VIGAN_05076200 [Vigna angularis var. angularis]